MSRTGSREKGRHGSRVDPVLGLRPRLSGMAAAPHLDLGSLLILRLAIGFGLSVPSLKIAHFLFKLTLLRAKLLPQGFQLCCL